jgi:hypothetical protein
VILSIRRLPLTTGLVSALVATALVKRRMDGAALDRAASTNLDNLASRPALSLLASAVVVEGDHWVAPAAGTAAALGGLEFLAGTRRAAAIAVAGHVLPTLASQAVVWSGIKVGRLPASARTQVDVGASYVIMAAVGGLMTVLPRRLRLIGSAIAVATSVGEVVATRQVVAIGHGLAFALGYLSRPVKIATGPS